MKTIVYVDGFNLYYRMLKARPALKWLNPKALAEQVLSAGHTVEQVNYFTARVSSRTYDPDAPARQATYLRALALVPEIVIHEGNFLTRDTWMPLAHPPQAKPDGYVWALPVPEVVKVTKSEEKGSDVSLGAHLVRDAFTHRFDVAAVITNDSDLAEPIRIAVHEAGKRVGVLVPVRNPTASLTACASFHLHIRPGHLARAQLPDIITSASGASVSRPSSWA
jgi:uncharacterized LabA/DUF88 family protein